jgi:hypothetical protein
LLRRAGFCDRYVVMLRDHLGGRTIGSTALGCDILAFDLVYAPTR